MSFEKSEPGAKAGPDGRRVSHRAVGGVAVPGVPE